MDDDYLMRLAAFQAVRSASSLDGQLSSAQLRGGFQFRGERFPLINPQRGIFKPRQMRHLLSIRTVYPRSGTRVWYDDQRQVHQQIYAGDETVDYAFMGSDAEAADNRWLRDAMVSAVPLIYFLGVAPGLYEAIVPAFVVGWDAGTLKARLAFGVPGQEQLAVPESGVERRYALREVKQRLHQASFRVAVINAYDGRCALSRLPEPSLLDAAHIIADRNERLGQPIVPNGLPLSKIHHAAFDSQLIGIDPDYKIHVAHRLLDQHDGPMLEALKALHAQRLQLPKRPQDAPDRDRLAERFALFRAST